MSQVQEGRRKKQGKLSKYKGYRAVCFCFFLVAMDLSWRGRGTAGGRLQKLKTAWLRKLFQQITREHTQRLPGKENRAVMTLGRYRNSMKHSVVCLCKAEGKSSKHRSGWAKPPTPTITSAEIKKIKTKNHYKTPLSSRLLTFLNAKGPVRTGGGRTIFSPVSSAQSLTQTCSLL